ncbi:MAG: FkbM family methyltransferase [Pseudomonadota bacterium]
MILARLFEGQKSGYFVDIGAHHPKRLSNTYHFYRKGWTGINVDAAPGSMDLFKKIRPRDVNIECGVGANSGTLTFYLYSEPALNSFSPDTVIEDSPSDDRIRPIEKTNVEVQPLHALLETHAGNRKIDFLSVDVEGYDFQVLKSNNWNEHRPKYVLVEIYGKSFAETLESEAGQFLLSVGYEICAKTVNTAFFRECTIDDVKGTVGA